MAAAVVLCINPAFAADLPQPPDAVDLMKAEYYDRFKELPPSRKCVPQDAHGAWKEIAIFEGAGTKEVAEQAAQGPRYIAFGAYNTLAWFRSKAPFDTRMLLESAVRGKVQYIATASGMLYVYTNGTLASSVLCFMSTDKTEKFNPHTLLLARPAEKDKPLTITLYAPLGN